MDPYRVVGGIGAILAALGASAALRRRGVMPELTRKVAHVSVSLAVLPIASSGLTPPIALALLAAFSMLMWALRRRRKLGFLDDVGRKGFSEYGFIGAAAWLAVVGPTHPAALRAAVLVLGLADAAAALIGSRFGRHRFAIGEGGHRSLEGSLAFVVVTCAVVLSSGVRSAPATAIVTALCVAVLIAAIEAVSLRGLDNLSVPLVTFALLADPMLSATIPSLAVHLFVGVITAAVLVRAGLPVALAIASALLEAATVLFDKGVHPVVALYVAAVAFAPMLAATRAAGAPVRRGIAREVAP